MFSLTRFNVRFTPSWSMVLLAFVFILLFCRLGVWQLERAAEKEHILQASDQLSKTKPIQWSPGVNFPKSYQPVVVQGHFLPEIFLLDNQHEQHQFGYHVISPLLMGTQVVLIDRGWVVGDPTRQQVPLVINPAGEQKVRGTAYFPSSNQMNLGQWLDKQIDQKMVIESIDPYLISQFLHKSVYPFIIRLDAHEANGYVRKWEVIAMAPERHYAYAAQWFAMAGVIMILFIGLNIKKIS